MSAGTFRDVDVADAVALAGDGYLVIDVREQAEWDEGHVRGATLLPLGEVVDRIAELVPDRDTPILLHCRSGARSGRAAAYLAQVGYTDVVNLNGFVAGWRAAGGAWEEPAPPLGAGDAARYVRQISLREVGVEGQRRLLDARVIVVGVGGLGSPVALYLAAAGIGTIGLVDDDAVDATNLHRQVIHATTAIGTAKVDSAAESLLALNPGVSVMRHPDRLTDANAPDLIAAYDIVVDATDTFDARYAINDAAVAARKPVVHGSVFRWEGQVTTFVPYEGPCYRCLHPVKPPPGLAPDCDVAGVLGVLPGVIGTLQATEVVKLVLGIGEPLVGRLLTFDALAGAFDTVRAEREQLCSTCGAEAAVPA